MCTSAPYHIAIAAYRQIKPMPDTIRAKTSAQSIFFFICFLKCLGYITGTACLDYQCPTGHLAWTNVLFSLIKHPHCLHLCKFLLNQGHVLQIASLASTCSLSAFCWLGSKRSKNSTSPLSFILNIITHMGLLSPGGVWLLYFHAEKLTPSFLPPFLYSEI